MVYLLQVYRSQYIRLQEQELLSESTWPRESSTIDVDNENKSQKKGVVI
jgi:hypothetical protein